MKRKWMLKNKTGNFEQISRQFGVSEMISRLLVNRNACEADFIEQYLHPTYQHLNSPLLLKDIDKACYIIKGAIIESSSIRIIGDYDVDGVVATYILYHAIKGMGAKVDYRIPERIRDGYGINITMIDQAYQDGINVILTCDNGISAVEQVAYAKKLGMKVVITDHHDVPDLIPDADAIINPKQTDCLYPYAYLCGAAVALKLIEALSLDNNETHNSSVVNKYIEFVTIATICDVVELSNENRAIVKLGFDKMKETTNIGLLALAQCNQVSLNQVSAYHLGYIIGPCINAGGRLETAEVGMSLLLEEDIEIAMKKAADLKLLNDARKNMTTEGLKEASEIISANNMEHDKVLLVFLPECHESLAGIIAGKVREQYNKPVIILTKGEDCIKGSARSIEEYNITEELTKCKDLLIKYGGHPLAAGLSLKQENVDLLRNKLNDNCKLDEDSMTPKLLIDILLPFGYVSEEVITDLNLLEPFGSGNAKPVFADKDLMILGASLIGKNGKFMKMQLKNPYGAVMDAVYFGNAKEMEHELINKFGEEEVKLMYQKKANKIRIHVAYYPGINEYLGNKNLQIVIQDFQIVN